MWGLSPKLSKHYLMKKDLKLSFALALIVTPPHPFAGQKRNCIPTTGWILYAIKEASFQIREKCSATILYKLSFLLFNIMPCSVRLCQDNF